MTDLQDGWLRLDDHVSGGVVVRGPGEGEIPTPPDGDMINVLVDGSHTRGLVSFMEYRVAPNGEGPPAHWHPGHDELFYVVQGELGMLGDRTRKVYQPRDFVFIPRGVMHTFWNPTDAETIFVSAWSPSGAEQAFVKAHELLQRFQVSDFEGIPREVLEEELIPLVGTNPAPADWGK
ncbi:cupin domain-containing protein [Nocardioides sp. QY071]|uniref:cupin domain-containing protein n=1 Tax=Nocardioides sp. QY071 TaxID=3044187 RepID=UPI00249B323F|nr:cupin domain-containing protein [Nocardioides sp. QY071]WGY00388.1 cupin domain-containing protein [Nocardioides sp. QY071]